MKIFAINVFLIVALFASISLKAQTPFIWIPEEVPSCFSGDSIISVKDFSHQSGCGDLILGNDLSTLTISNSLTKFLSSGDYTYSNIPNVIPGQAGSNESGSIQFYVEGDIDVIDTENSSIRIAVDFDGQISSYPSLSFSEILRGNSNCKILIPYGAKMVIQYLNITLNEDWIPETEVDLNFSYQYLQEAVPYLSNIIIPDSCFDGQAYNFALPSGNTSIITQHPLWTQVGLETPISDNHLINISKQGGILTLPTESVFTSSGPSDLTVNLQDLGLCLLNTEMTIRDQSHLILDNVDIDYGGDEGCLRIDFLSQLTIPKDGFQILGNEGRNLQLWYGDAKTTLEENSTLILDNIFKYSYFTPRYDVFFYVHPGARLEVTVNTSLANPFPSIPTYHIKLYEGATFDMSAAPADVQDIFIVESVSSSHNTLPPSSSYLVYPNPTIDRSATVKLSPGTKPLSSIEALDAAGRMVAVYTNLSGESEYSIQLPRRGVYILRLTDIEGRVGHKRVIRQ